PLSHHHHHRRGSPRRWGWWWLSGCIAQTSAQRSCRQRDGLHQAAVGGATPGSLHGGGDALPNRPGLTPSAVEKVRAPCRQECAWGGWASGSFVGGRTSSAPPPCGECAQRGNISDAYRDER